MRKGFAREFMESPREEKESAVSCLSVQCTRAHCVVGLMLVLGRGVWVKEISRPCVLAQTNPYLLIPDPLRPRPEVMFEFAASAVFQRCLAGH